MRLAGKKIHFMGAGGIGVSALAHMAARYGATVTACDRAENDQTRALVTSGIPVSVGHDARHVDGVDLLVYTSAVPANHPERLAAARQEPRGRFLARFLDMNRSTGVCGTHGKTTTSWLLADMMIRAGLDPSVFIGGVAAGLGGKNYRLGHGPFVSELDESDGTFLLPHLAVAVITNIESDHLSHYGDDASLFGAFASYADGVREEGLLVAGVDSPEAERIFSRHGGRKVSFAIDRAADMKAVDIAATSDGCSFGVIRHGNDLGRFTVPLPGRHTVQNTLAALAAGLEMGVPLESARSSLALATGVGRRMERLGRFADAVLYSDYAHHPTEVSAAIAGLKQRHPGRTLVVFQPHLYSRTRDYWEQFAQALTAADGVVLADIYPAREEPIPGVTSSLIVDCIRKLGGAVEGPFSLEAIPAAVRDYARGCEAIMMTGAGDIDAVARTMAEQEAG